MLDLARKLPHGPDTWADAERPGGVVAVPDRIGPAMAGGVPDVTLALHGDGVGGGGALLSARLRLLLSQSAPFRRVAAPLDARVRLISRVAGLALGGWADAYPDGEDALRIGLAFDRAAGEIVRRLTLEQTEVVELTVAFDVAGLAPGRPWRAELAGAELIEFLDTAMADAEADDADAQARAFLMVPDHLVRFMGRGDGTARSDLLAELWPRVRPLLTRGRDTLIAAEDVGPLGVDLSQPRVVRVPRRATWSLTDFATDLSEAGRARHFPALREIAPFADAEITVLNEIPLSDGQAMAVTVDVRAPGPAGVPEDTRVSFGPDDAPLAVVPVRFPAIGRPLEVESRLRLSLAPSGGGFPVSWPTARSFEPAADPRLIRIDKSRAQLAMVRLQAGGGLFDLCGAVRARLDHDGGESVATIDAATPETWIALPGHGADGAYGLTLELEPPEGVQADAVVLRNGPETARTLLVTRFDASVRAPDRVAVRIGGDAIPFAVVDLRGPENAPVRTHVIRPNETVEIAIWRSNLFAPLAFEWRAAVVRLDAQGQPSPITQGDWLPGHGGHLEIM
ncbi:MAG: hypothetical protein AAGE03_03705 [Pseudomonadota bacterium]